MNDDRLAAAGYGARADAGARPSAAELRRRRRPASRNRRSRRSTSSPATSSNSIHQAALEVLKEIGIDFLHDEARAMLSEAGADVDPASRRVRFDPALVEAHIGLAPKEFTLHARNPARNLMIGGRHVAFGSVASAPNSFDRAGGRRPGNKRDYPELHPPRAELRFDPFLGRLSGRADRHSRLRPPSRRAVRHADAVRQADPRL